MLYSIYTYIDRNSQMSVLYSVDIVLYISYMMYHIHIHVYILHNMYTNCGRTSQTLVLYSFDIVLYILYTISHVYTYIHIYT